MNLNKKFFRNITISCTTLVIIAVACVGVSIGAQRPYSQVNVSIALPESWANQSYLASFDGEALSVSNDSTMGEFDNNINLQVIDSIKFTHHYKDDAGMDGFNNGSEIANHIFFSISVDVAVSYASAFLYIDSNNGKIFWNLTNGNFKTSYSNRISFAILAEYDIFWGKDNWTHGSVESEKYVFQVRESI